MIVVADSSLRRGDAGRLLRRTNTSILISREGMTVERLLATEGELTSLIESLAACLQATGEIVLGRPAAAPTRSSRQAEPVT